LTFSKVSKKRLKPKAKSMCGIDEKNDRVNAILLSLFLAQKQKNKWV